MKILARKGLNKRDLCKGGIDEKGFLMEAMRALFSLEYTIPHTQLKDVQLLSEADWNTFLEEAGKRPTAPAKLVIKEKR
jgi:hypothetical protein